MYKNQRFDQATNRVAIIRGRRSQKNASPRVFHRVRRTTVAKLRSNTKLVKSDRINLNIPGANYIFDSKKGFYNKLFWLLVITCNVSICIYHVYDRFQFFLSKPTATETTVTRNSSVKFPSVTICRPYNSPISLFPLLHQISKRGHDCKNDPLTLLPELNISTIWHLMNIQNVILFEFIHAKISHNKTFHKTSTPTVLGNCTTYSIKTLVNFRDGYMLGFEFNVSNGLQPCNATRIAAILFHPDDLDITYVGWQYFTDIVIGHPVEYTLTAKRFSTTNIVDSSCDSVAFVSQCKKKCFEDFLKKIMKCRLPITQTDEFPLCDETTNTYRELNSRIDLIQTFDFAEKCTCPAICDEIIYNYHKMYIVNFPDNVLMYYFEHNVVTHIKEYYSYTLIPFLSEIGGTMGLFLGLSIPAIIELLQSVVLYLYNKVANRT